MTIRSLAASAPALLLLAACETFLPGRGGFTDISVSHTAFHLAGPGDTVTLQATVRERGEAGDRVVYDPSRYEIAWRSLDPGVAEIGSSGRVTAVAEGRTIIWAEVEGQRDSATVFVGPPPREGIHRWMDVGLMSDGGCAVTVDGATYCWGKNFHGQMGLGHIRASTDTYRPVRAAAITKQWHALETGLLTACGVEVHGTLWCWGAGNGQLGDGSRTYRKPYPVRPRLPGPVISASAATNHACAVVADGSAYCWGGNLSGELGIGSEELSGRTAPVRVASDRAFSTIFAASRHTCALEAETGRAFCWGGNEYAQLGNGTLEASSVPAPVSGGLTFVTLAIGEVTSCGLTPEGVTYCWGTASWGSMPGQTATGSLTPFRLGTTLRFEEISGGGGHFCARTAEGMVYCWGNAASGQGGVPPVEADDLECPGVIGRSVPCLREPRLVSDALLFRSISTQPHRSCGVTRDGTTYCWGSNRFGALGVGTLEEVVSTPTRVADPL